ncbi:MAG: DUF4157 domain-containing protein [Nostoc sp.]|uniref:eCIS core domain-containing protein n=1 Tax=Nostoc sp. TaxID=1180 RepID=UPI002FFAF28D
MIQDYYRLFYDIFIFSWSGIVKNFLGFEVSTLGFSANILIKLHTINHQEEGLGKISDRMMPQKKAATSSFSNPSLLLSNIPTLANPVRGFGLPPVSKTATQESISLQEEQPATEQLSESETRQKAPLSHDISRMSLRSQSRINFSFPTDPDEQEADSMMPKVMRVAVPEPLTGVDESIAQDILQPKYAAREEEEEEKLPMQPLLQRVAKDGGLEVDNHLESQLTNTKGGGSPLADEVRTYMEPRFGNDFSQVRVHTDSAAVQMNRDLSAQAFTHGSDIYFGAGKNPAKDELTAHELTHVVQQTGGKQQNSQVQRRLQSEPKSEVSDQISAVSSNKESFKQPPMDKQEALADKVAQEQSSKGTEKEQPQGKQANGNVDSNKAEENKNQPQPQNQPQVEQVNPQQSGGGGTKASQSMGSQGQANEAVAQQAAPLNAEDPGQILEQLKNTPPTQAFATYTQAETASAQALDNQRQQLQATIPEIPAPTGLSPQTADAAPKNSAPATPQLGEPASAQGQVNPVADSAGGLSGAIASSKSSQNPEGSSQEPDINAISTNAGERPKVDMTGEADPSQMHGEQAESLQQVQAAKGKAASTISQDFGENNIFPKASNQTLKANKELSKVSPSSGKGGEIPTISPEIVGGLNQGLTPYYQAKIAPEQQKYLTGKQQFEADSGNARQDSNQKITNFNEEAKQKQLEQQKQSQEEVAQARQNWKLELDNTEKDYQDKAGKATKEQQQKIDEEKRKGEQDADKKLADAEQEAADQKKKAEEDAAKEKEKEKEKGERKSGWDKFWGGVKDIGSAIVEGIKKVVNAIYDGLRKAVKAIFDAVKTVVTAIINAVRTIIVGLIKAFGEILKGLVQIVFAAFPEISKKFTDAIDKAVNKATEIVNSVADFLQKAVSTVLDFLATTLDKLLGLVQGIYNAAFTIIGMIVRGEFGELIKRFGNLIEGAKAMPDQFATAGLEELMGGGELDLDKPLAPEELAQAKQAGVSIPGMGGENTPETGEAGEMPKAPWSEENVGVDAVEDNMELSPEIAEELMQQSNGEGEVMLAESQEESRSMDAIVSETGEKQVGGQEQQEIPDDGLSPQQRASIKWELMKDGIKQWFSKNWPTLLVALIAASAVIIAAIVATGGAILAALPILMEILTVVFAADTIAKIGGYLSDYLSKSWEGNIQGGGKSLAKALAAGAIELAMLLTFEAGKAASKGVKAVAKGAAKVARKASRAVIKGIKYIIKKGKVLFKGIARSGVGKQFKKLGDLGKALLDRMRFKGFRIRVANGWFRLEGLINPWVLIAEGKIQPVKQGTENAVEVTEDALEKLNKFMGQRGNLKDPDAIKFFDQKYNAIVGDATNPKKIDAFERYLNATAKKQGDDLQKGLLEEYKKVNKPPEVKAPHGKGVSELPRLRQEAENLKRDIKTWLETEPDINRVERIIKTIDRDLKGPMTKMEQGTLEATIERIEGFNNNLKGARSEFEQARTAPPGTEIGVHKTFEGKKIEIDQIRPDGTWVNVKNYELFGKESKKFTELEKQAQMNLRAAQANPLPNGKIPTILFDFGEKGVTTEVAEALRAINVNVTGREIPWQQ